MRRIRRAFGRSCAVIGWTTGVGGGRRHLVASLRVRSGLRRGVAARNREEEAGEGAEERAEGRRVSSHARKKKQARAGQLGAR